ncbi:hypothetical protein VTN00DRAFT_5159 [Thermoascus crustaceus]|uniref:uncharacterized protein n=1 Tax=Thermoascus crustaceus TaxID=5088 RepID=UPI0037434B4B
MTDAHTSNEHATSSLDDCLYRKRRRASRPYVGAMAARRIQKARSGVFNHRLWRQISRQTTAARERQKEKDREMVEEEQRCCKSGGTAAVLLRTRLPPGPMGRANRQPSREKRGRKTAPP